MNPRTHAWMNVAIFTPIAIYGWQGKRPPTWLIITSIVYAAALVAMDINTLLEPNKAANDLTISPSDNALVPGGARVPTFTQIQRYGVNRV